MPSTTPGHERAPELLPPLWELAEFDDLKPGHNCGLAVVCLDPDRDDPGSPPFVLYSAMQDIDHRGGDAHRLVISRQPNDTGYMPAIGGSGSVVGAFGRHELAGAANGGNCGIGHVRYRTSGARGQDFAHPILGNGFWLAFNGEVRLDAPEGSTDAFELVDLISRRRKVGESAAQTAIKVLSELPGSAFTMAIMEDDELYLLRDDVGFHPFVYGYSPIHQGYIGASETPSLRNLGVTEISSLPNGHIAKFSPGQQPDVRPFIRGVGRPQICAIESIYFTRADGVLEGEAVYEQRKRAGMILAQNDPDLHIDLIAPVPDSARPAASGYHAIKTIAPREDILIKPTSDRSFTQGTQSDRITVADRKHQIIQSQVEDKVILLIEDSIVRGTTLRGLVRRLYGFGAKEVHLRIASPPLMWDCLYGINIKTREELIAFQNSGNVEAIRQHLGTDHNGVIGEMPTSLKYLTVEEYRRSLGGELGKRACMRCFTGRDPIIAAPNSYYWPF